MQGGDHRTRSSAAATWRGGRTGGGRSRGPGSGATSRPHRAGVEVGGAVGHGAGAAGQHQARELLAALARDARSSSCPSARRRHRRTGSRGRAGALVGHAADGLGEAAVVDAVQHHLGHGDLAVERLAARLEVDRLREALPLGVAARPPASRRGRERRAAPARRGFAAPRGTAGRELSGSTPRLATRDRSSSRAVRARAASPAARRARTAAALEGGMLADARSPARRRRPRRHRQAPSAANSAASTTAAGDAGRRKSNHHVSSIVRAGDGSPGGSV